MNHLGHVTRYLSYRHFFCTITDIHTNYDIQLNFWDITSKALKKVYISLTFWNQQENIYLKKNFFFNSKQIGIYKTFLVP